MTKPSKQHPHDPIGRELHDLLDYEAAVDDALAVANWRPEVRQDVAPLVGAA